MKYPYYDKYVYLFSVNSWVCSGWGVYTQDCKPRGADSPD